MPEAAIEYREYEVGGIYYLFDLMPSITRETIQANMPKGTTEVVIPDGVKNISDYVFIHQLSLTSLVIPESAEGIAEEAFGVCSSLSVIVLPDASVANSEQYSITANQTVIPSIVFNQWKQNE